MYLELYKEKEKSNLNNKIVTTRRRGTQPPPSTTAMKCYQQSPPEAPNLCQRRGQSAQQKGRPAMMQKAMQMVERNNPLDMDDRDERNPPMPEMTMMMILTMLHH